MSAEFDTLLKRDPRGRPYIALDVPSGPGEILPTPAGRAEEVLRNRYAGLVSDPQWSIERALNQLWGVPTEMDITEIAAEIERGGEGAFGGVFLTGPGRQGHVVNVRFKEGKAFFYDLQNGLSGSQLDGMFSQATKTKFYRVK
jgi:hypothetical protein